MSDQIEKQVTLKAPRERVWKALTDATQFGAWFGVRLDGPFVAGKVITGRMAPTQVDAEVARMQEPFAGLPVEWHVERIDPMDVFAFRWHPFAIEKGVDYSGEPMTLVMFELTEVKDGTLLRITETGFDRIPTERRAKAFAANERGWGKQTELLAKYLAR